ncbi:MAG: glycosyltransferase [Acidobacteriota bacterium]
MKISIVIPAYNEEKYLPDTLAALTQALALVDDAEIIVVDNMSTDSTTEIAANCGANVVTESVRNIGYVRNTGANASTGDVIVFIDADSIVRPGVFEKIIAAMSDERCLGGSAAVEYEPIESRIVVIWFMLLWPFLGKLMKMRGGALQFCRAEIFRELGGYDTSIYVGEDIDFHWRLDKLAVKRACFTAFIEEPRVLTSSRRWNKMGLVRMMFFTHPITVLLAWRIRSFWKDWYEDVIR